MLPPPVPELPAHLVCGAALLPSRTAILPLLPKNKVIVEVGVGLGWFSNQLLWTCTPSRFVAIDTFRLHENPDVFGMPAAERFGGLSHRAYYEKEFEKHPGRDTMILRMKAPISSISMATMAMMRWRAIWPPLHAKSGRTDT